MVAPPKPQPLRNEPLSVSRCINGGGGGSCDALVTGMGGDRCKRVLQTREGQYVRRTEDAALSGTNDAVVMPHESGSL